MFWIVLLVVIVGGVLVALKHVSREKSSSQRTAISNGGRSGLAKSATPRRLKFRTTEVTQLYDEIGAWCHPDYPFLDRNYSPGSNMPAIDFTPYIAAWLARGREDAVGELWSYVTYQGDASRFALRKALNAQFPSWIQLPDAARQELRAIYVLTMRAALCSNLQNMADVGASLAATTLGSQQLTLPPDYDRGEWSAEMTRATKTIPLAPAYSVELLKMVRSEMGKCPSPESVHRSEEGAKLALGKALSPLGVAEAAAQKLESIPPTARFVVYDYVFRGWGQGTLRYDLYYEHRAYGCGGEANRRYVQSLGFFGPPSDDGPLPAAVTKDVLRETLESRGVQLKKSTPRKEMVERVRQIPGLVSRLIAEACPAQQELHSHSKESVKEWATRVRYVEPVARAVFKMLAVKGMK